MFQGKYTLARKDFGEYRVDKFRAHFDRDYTDDFGTCGSHALSMLTGKSLDYFAKELKRSSKLDWWTDRNICRWLRKNEYTVVSVTMADVLHNSWNWRPLGNDHVLLVSQNMNRMEGTWALLNKGNYYHVGDKEKTHPLEFMNNPLTAVYIIYHEKWLGKKRKEMKLKAMTDVARWKEIGHRSRSHRDGFNLAHQLGLF